MSWWKMDLGKQEFEITEIKNNFISDFQQSASGLCSPPYKCLVKRFHWPKFYSGNSLPIRILNGSVGVRCTVISSQNCRGPWSTENCFSTVSIASSLGSSSLQLRSNNYSIYFLALLQDYKIFKYLFVKRPISFVWWNWGQCTEQEKHIIHTPRDGKATLLPTAHHTLAIIAHVPDKRGCFRFGDCHCRNYISIGAATYLFRYPLSELIIYRGRKSSMIGSPPASLTSKASIIRKKKNYLLLKPRIEHCEHQHRLHPLASRTINLRHGQQPNRNWLIKRHNWTIRTRSNIFRPSCYCRKDSKDLAGPVQKQTDKRAPSLDGCNQ